MTEADSFPVVPVQGLAGDLSSVRQVVIQNLSDVLELKAALRVSEDLEPVLVRIWVQGVKSADAPMSGVICGDAKLNRRGKSGLAAYVVPHPPQQHEALGSGVVVNLPWLLLVEELFGVIRHGETVTIEILKNNQKSN